MIDLKEFSEIAERLHPAAQAAESRRDTIVVMKGLERLLGPDRAGRVATNVLGIAAGKIRWEDWRAVGDIIRKEAELALNRLTAIDDDELPYSSCGHAWGARHALAEAVRILSESRDTSGAVTAASFYLSQARGKLMEAATPSPEDESSGADDVGGCDAEF